MMPLIVVASAVVLLVAYSTYGRLLPRLFGLNAVAETPAVTLRDDVDYVPCDSGPLLSQHFSAIAAAGPIVGPILAGAMFGWAPALLWILLGSIFVGGVHDFAALVASIRHRANSIAEVVRLHVSGRAFVLFLLFVWLALVYIIVAFTDITASAFVGSQAVGDVQITGPGIASSSLMYLALPIVMGLLVRKTGISLDRATLAFIPLVGIAIWLGQKFPLEILPLARALHLPGDDVVVARQVWDILLLLYCCVASVVPMWLLLQPRGQLGGYFLYGAILAGGLGLMTGGEPVALPAFKGWEASPGGASLFPMLFITIACGACSGFHALIASGTTSKQLKRETDARAVGYGAMLLESMVAVISLCCVMMIAPDSPLAKATPDRIYAEGIGAFLGKVGISRQWGVAFALMAFTTFIYDTLDVCTRLGRYIIQELTGLKGSAGKWLGTILTAGVPAYFVTRTTFGPDGEPVPVWQTFWQLFGASNQLLAALTLLGITVWLWRTRRVRWVWLVAGLPAVLMYAMSSWALVTIIRDAFSASGPRGNPVAWIAVTLVALASVMLVEAMLAIIDPGTDPSLPEPEIVPA